MSNVVIDIESKTLNLIFRMLDADIKLLIFAVKNSWKDGKEHYEKRLNIGIQELSNISTMIDSVIKTYSSDIDDYKKVKNTVFTMIDMDDMNDINKLDRQVKNIKMQIETKIKKLESINWERDLRIAGFYEYNKRNDYVNNNVSVDSNNDNDNE